MINEVQHIILLDLELLTSCTLTMCINEKSQEIAHGEMKRDNVFLLYIMHVEVRITIFVYAQIVYSYE